MAPNVLFRVSIYPTTHQKTFWEFRLHCLSEQFKMFLFYKKICGCLPDVENTFCHLPFRGPCRTSFPTSQSWPRGFFTITWQSGSFRRLVCSIPSSSLLLGSDSSAMCPHASEIGSGSAPPVLPEFKAS